jgi:poly(3-hydroxybutyrate) depolymerase
MKSTTVVLALAGAFLLFGISPRESLAAHETGDFVLKAQKGATYTLLVPEDYDRRKGATLLFWLHGAGDNHANAARSIKARAFKPQWIVAIPDATANGSWQPDELDRVMDVVDEVEKAYTIRRTFIGGFSRGGFFTFQFGLQRTDRFAGYLCVSGGLPNPALVRKEDADRFAVAIVHGEADGVVPFDSGVKARDAFQKAGWKKKFFFRSVPGLAHTIDQAATQAALDFLDENAQVFSTPKDYYEYGMKVYAQGQMGRAWWAFSQLDETESGREKWWSKVKSTRKKIEAASEKAGKKLVKSITADKNPKWVPEWETYRANFEDTPYYPEALATFEALVKTHNEAAAEFLAAAVEEQALGETKTAIKACLSIRDTCYVADSEAVAKARELLAGFRADPEISRKFRSQLKGTEDWK